MSTVAEREVEISIELGRTSLVADREKALQSGSAIPLDSSSGDPVDVYADGELIARGALLVRDGFYFVRVIELTRQAHAS